MAKTLDRFDLMRLYVRIAETGSLSAAGRSLGLSQPSASRQLRQLEAELGTQLIMRTTHELSFTEAGQTFLSQARQLVGDWEAVTEQYRQGQAAVRGRIRIAAPTGLGQTVLADLAGSFVARFPEVTIDWLLDDAPRDLIAEGIDLWIWVGPIADESLIVRGLWQIERVLVTSSDADIQATHPYELIEVPAVTLGPYVGQSIDLKDAKGEVVTLTPSIAISTDNIFAAHRLALAGHGYSILPRWLVQPAIDAGQARILCPGWHPPSLNLSMAYPQSRYRPARLSLFMEHVQAELPTIGAGITVTAA